MKILEDNKGTTPLPQDNSSPLMRFREIKNIVPNIGSTIKYKKNSWKERHPKIQMRMN